MHVILVPHPGAERIPRSGRTDVPWPPEGATHQRKYLRATGRVFDAHGLSKQPEALEFWGEYEGPTEATALAKRERGCPTCVHDIVLPPGEALLNTDPWVFHPGFVWSICRHNSIRDPVDRGTVVLFGSSVGRRWLLDTFIVVSHRLSGRKSSLGSAYDELVAPTIEASDPFVGTLPSGDCPFSFVPASRLRRDAGFARPDISKLLTLLRLTSTGASPSPANSQALVHCTGPDSFWDKVVSAVFTNGLLLGVEFLHPLDLHRRKNPLGRTGRRPTSRCS